MPLLMVAVILPTLVEGSYTNSSSTMSEPGPSVNTVSSCNRTCKRPPGPVTTCWFRKIGLPVVIGTLLPLGVSQYTSPLTAAAPPIWTALGAGAGGGGLTG